MTSQRPAALSHVVPWTASRTLAAFLAECCQSEASGFVPTATLHDAHREWARRNHATELSAKQLGRLLAAREGYSAERAYWRGRQVRGWRGLLLRDDRE